MIVVTPVTALASASVSEEVYRAIRGAILDLTLEPGSTISENALARELGASRTPVREAIQRLERERLLFVFPQRGTVVAPLDLDEFRAAYFVRSSLECAAAAEAARRASPADVARLHQHVETHMAALAVEDERTFFALNDAFHIEIMTIAGVPSVWSVVQNAKVHLDRVRIAHLTRASNYPLAPIVEEHRQLVAAIAAGAPDEAAAIMYAHIAKVLHRVDLLRDLRPELFEMPRDLTAQVRAISGPASAGRRSRASDR
ncbi:MAG: GntR family transcriptional regulator [Chelatococcus sp.]|uniref:GntR family transcriptional regulator n=1 Tax=Chelatococcus sp. TaxID=1953771 RepID=UPI0025BAEBBC|nr:GntR family transcriptional regulator [Chelatococcus sp.]MBX3540762.1 GntR family transcriptional regulator [Chelatococcus sp.]